MLSPLLEELDENKYTPDFLKNVIFNDLGVVFGQVKCLYCGTTYYIDKPAPATGHQCPMATAEGFPHLTTMNVDTASLLNSALTGPKADYIVKPIKIELKSGPKTKNQTYLPDSRHEAE